MPLLFAYGTLQLESVQLATFGRRLEGRPDKLPMYEATAVRIKDPQVAAQLGRTHHANVSFNGRDESAVTGTAFEVTDAELETADRYEEPASYERILVTLGSGRAAWVYRHAGSARSSRMTGLLRQAERRDVRAIQRVRHSVRENRLTSTVISDADVVDAIERTGRGWVVEADGEVVAFAVGNAETGNIWALFVDPAHEARGYGRRLHDEMLAWLWQQGLGRLWLTTAPGTRAQRFYESAGWQNGGVQPSGELLFERYAP